MRVVAIKQFYSWARRHELSDALMQKAVDEISSGIVDAKLGGNLYKKRIATKGRGKSGSVRTLLAYSTGARTIFLYAFEKSDRGNITQKEKTALQELGKFYLNLNDTDFTSRLRSKAIIEITDTKEQHNE